MILFISEAGIVGLVLVAGLTFLFIRLGRAIDRMDEVDPNERDRSFIARLWDAWT